MNYDDNLITQVVETIPKRSFSTTWIYKPKRILSLWFLYHT